MVAATSADSDAIDAAGATATSVATVRRLARPQLLRALCVCKEAPRRDPERAGIGGEPQPIPLRARSFGKCDCDVLGWQAVVGLGAGLFLYFNPETSTFVFYSTKEGAEAAKVTDFGFPLLTFCIPFGLLAIPFFMAVLMGTSNAVNLTDGLDGLATGVTITVAIAYAVITYLGGRADASEYLHIFHNPGLSELCIVMMALVGACFGFLWFNCHPAKVFMGDTGSLAIGGAIGMTAICAKQEFLLVIIGFVFVMEAVSVILQVGGFKLRRKRLFAMAPIHHHFELRGWNENQVIIRFWIISILCSLGGLALLKVI